MTTPKSGDSRIRAYLQFIIGVLYFFVARGLAARSAAGLASDDWASLVEQVIFAFLLLLGYAVMGFWFNRQVHPIREQGLPRREGWRNEIALGLATGWGLAVACVLPMVLFGGIAISISTTSAAWKWLALDAAWFVFATLVEEVAFRGYAFQRFVRAVGPVGGSLGFAAYYAVVQSFQPGSNRVTFCVSLAIALLLSVAYLRTKALWISWGLNFGWKASRALLFGLAVTGVNSNSPVVQGNPMGPFWITGGGFGLESSWITFMLVLGAMIVVYKLTKDLDYRYNVPDIVPGGFPVDLGAAAHAQHNAAMGTDEPAPASLVQIGSAPAVASESPKIIDPRSPGDSY